MLAATPENQSAAPENRPTAGLFAKTPPKVAKTSGFPRPAAATGQKATVCPGARIVLNPQRGASEPNLISPTSAGLVKRCELSQLALRFAYLAFFAVQFFPFQTLTSN
jgi:hypothetical protein